MKKIILSLLIGSTLGGSIVQPAFTVYASEKINDTETEYVKDTTTKVENTEALSIYKKLITNQTKVTNRVRTVEKEITENLPEEFNEITLLENTNPENIENIYSDGDENLQTVINYNVDSDTYSLFEVNVETEEIIMLINDKEYTVRAEGENIDMISENGEVLPLVITEYQNSTAILPELIDANSEPIIGDTEIIVQESEQITSPLARASFGKERGPFTKTNKTLVEVLAIISTATGLVYRKVRHPLLGEISFITGLVATVGTYAYKTLYIKYWQASSTSNATYIRERDNYYNYNNYTGFVKSRTWHFYSSRPY